MRIHVLGNVQLDVLANPVDELPQPGGDSVIDRVDVRPAGAAGNVSLALAALGTPHRLFSAIGDDYAGRWTLAELERLGLAADILTKPGPTGISVAVESPTRERAFLTAYGALSSWTLTDLPEDAYEADYFFLTGLFSLPALRPHARTLLEKAKAHGATTLLDTGWDPDDWKTTARQEVLDLLPLVDFYLPNEPEALAVTNQPTATAALSALTATTILKQGPQGAITSTFAVAAPAVTPLDTTGAGDSLAAALISELAHGNSLEQALTFAVRYASAVVTRPSENRHPSRAELTPPPAR
jgi:sugar/nucleoside kinase (ribokinase family)